MTAGSTPERQPVFKAAQAAGQHAGRCAGSHEVGRYCNQCYRACQWTIDSTADHCDRSDFFWWYRNSPSRLGPVLATTVKQ